MPAPEHSSLSTVVVHVDLTDAATDRISLALRVAERHGGLLRGVAAGKLYVPVYAPLGETMLNFQPELIAQIQRETVRQLAAAESRFRAIASDGEWRQAQTLEPESFVASQARSADLVVVGRQGSQDRSDPVMGVAPSDIIMTAGRPVLVVPPKVNLHSGRRIVIGWKDGRETRRAIHDALPFLRCSDETFIVSVGHDEREAEMQDVAAYLGRYGVNAKVLMQRGGPGSVADSLIEVAQRVDADLIVMGGFGHSRAQEWILGGVTRDLLDHTPVCCLLSH